MLRKLLCVTLVFTFVFLSFHQVEAGDDAAATTEASKDAAPAAEKGSTSGASASNSGSTTSSTESKNPSILDLIFKPLLQVPKKFASTLSGLFTG